LIFDIYIFNFGYSIISLCQLFSSQNLIFFGRPANVHNIIMPITSSAKKALRQNIKRRAKNANRKERIKDLIKQAKFLIASKKMEEVKKILPQIYKIIDKGAKIGIIKKNNASRKKSRITKLINKLT